MNETILEQQSGSTTTLTREQTSLIGSPKHSHDVWKEVIDLYDLENCE